MDFIIFTILFGIKKKYGKNYHQYQKWCNKLELFIKVTIDDKSTELKQWILGSKLESVE